MANDTDDARSGSTDPDGWVRAASRMTLGVLDVVRSNVIGDDVQPGREPGLSDLVGSLAQLQFEMYQAELVQLRAEIDVPRVGLTPKVRS